MNPSLRPWTEADADNLLRYGNNPAIAANMVDAFPNPYLPENAESFIRFATSEQPVRILAIDIDGEAVGSIGLHPQADIFRMNAELGYWLGEPFWGKGIMTRAIQQMVVYGFENFQFNRIFARPFGSNLGSQKALEKAGFQFEARLKNTFYKNGKYIDELIYSVWRDAV